jgi:predicted  nucleic acid-binding Zn-ribbon protein
MKPDKEKFYAYYSRVLKEPFDSIDELKEAEEAYYAKLKAKEDKAATKKADALKVEEAFKALNAARKTFKNNLDTLTSEYRESLTELKESFEEAKKAVYDDLAAAETNYSKELKAFTEKYPEGYHLTLKDGDFETTISSKTTSDKPYAYSVMDLLDSLFNF